MSLSGVYIYRQTMGRPPQLGDADLEVAKTSQDTSPDTADEIPSSYQIVKQLSVQLASGTFTFTHWCLGKVQEVAGGKYRVCIGKNRLTGRMTASVGGGTEDLILDESVGKRMDTDYGSSIYDGPALMWVKPVFYDPKFYPEGFLPADVLLSYGTDPSFNGDGEGVGTISEPVTHLVLGKDFSGKNSLQVVQGLDQQNIFSSSFGPVGKAVFVEGPLCSGAACTMDPAPLKLYDVYEGSSHPIGKELATLQYATTDFNDPQHLKKYRLWGDIVWESLTSVQAQIIEPDGSTTTVHVPVN